MKKLYLISLILLSISITCHAQRKGENSIVERDLYSDTWVATDAIGRTMPTYEQTGEVKSDKQRVVGMFYITWHTQDLHNQPNPYTGDITQILLKDPSARRDTNHPAWRHVWYHYAEPEMGYFLSQDEWVIRKDMSMLIDAGVDVIILDATNAVRYWDEWEVIFKTMQQMKAQVLLLGFQWTCNYRCARVVQHIL